jgi:hypothetical protein
LSSEAISIIEGCSTKQLKPMIERELEANNWSVSSSKAIGVIEGWSVQSQNRKASEDRFEQYRTKEQCRPSDWALKESALLNGKHRNEHRNNRKPINEVSVIKRVSSEASKSIEGWASREQSAQVFNWRSIQRSNQAAKQQSASSKGAAPSNQKPTIETRAGS